jgi:nitroreductase
VGVPSLDDDMLDILASTRAIRRYQPEPIPDADLQQMLFAATRAPTGSNRQGFRFMVLTDGEAAMKAKSLMGAAARAMWADKRVADRYDDGTGARPNSPKARMAQTMEHFVDNFESTPAVVLACIERHRAPSPTEGASVYPAVQNLLIAARVLGYGGVITMWQAGIEDELREILGIPAHIGLCCVVPLGKPAGGGHGPVRRRPLGELVSGDQWGVAPTWAIDPQGTRHTQAGPKT